MHLTNTYLIKSLLIAIALLCYVSLLSEPMNKLVVSGQVTNYEHGNPVYNHPVYIESNSNSHIMRSYTKTVYTDINGYYYDTISTSENKGSLHIYTVDHFGNTVDTTLHFRFFSRASSIILADFSIYLPNQLNDLQARFKYVQKSGGDKNSFAFFDETKCENILNWWWDFGDGSYSNKQNPTHTYHNFGLYRVTLTVEGLVEGEVTKNSIIKQVFLREFEFYHLGGHVFSQYFPIDKGYAYLYYIDSANNYISIDTMPFDTLGYYYFYQIPEGKYIVKAEPMKESEYYGILMPTYYGNSFHWEDANIINLNNTSWEYDIALHKAIGVVSGSGSISGRVEFVLEGKAHSGIFAEGVNIYLCDLNNNMLTCHYTDDVGEFIFNAINIDNYMIYPEVTGVSNEPVPIELTIENPVVENLEIVVTQNGINYSFPGSESDYQFIGMPYPNPARDRITVPVFKSDSRFIVEIFDSFGQKILDYKYEGISDKIVLPIDELTIGYYTIVFSTIEKRVIRKLIVSN